MSLFEAQIVAASLEDLRALGKLNLDLKHRAARQKGRNRFVVPGILNEEEIKKAKAAGYEVHIIDDLSEMLDARKREVSRENRFLTARRVSDMATRTVEDYLTAEEVEEALINLSNEKSLKGITRSLKKRNTKQSCKNSEGKKKVREVQYNRGQVHSEIPSHIKYALCIIIKRTHRSKRHAGAIFR